MALVTCPECGHEVSSKAVSCPSCGAPAKGAKKATAKKGGCGSGCLMLIVLLGIFWGITSIATGKAVQEREAREREQRAEEARLLAITQAKKQELREAFLEVTDQKIEEWHAALDANDLESARAISQQFIVHQAQKSDGYSEAHNRHSLATLPIDAPEMDPPDRLNAYIKLAELDPESDYTKEIEESKVALAEFQRLAKEKAEKEAFAKHWEQAKNSHFSAWDGSHRATEHTLKQRLHDPDSYEHIETKFIPPKVGDKTYKVFLYYRAKNGFGAVRKGGIVSECAIETGAIQSIVEIE